MKEKIGKELVYREYMMREEMLYHAPFNPEMEFYEAVKTGDEKTVEKSLKDDFTSKPGFGQLSKNRLQSFKYHFAITAAMLARYCIDGGMEHEQAYMISDYYIEEADGAVTLKQISALHRKMVRDYTKRMKVLRTGTVYSPHIVKCVHYIYDHLHEKIYLDELAEEAGIDPSYLSRLFKQEMGMPVSEYIMRKKVETAANMLEYAQYTPSEIANILAFSSQSYFVSVFRKYTGTTPGKYRMVRNN
ncbi:MAG: AraC family transcriptional regulator [Lachnospiraceae bacterium]|nr:AraC family transcriptional regulator [Lachnospiraceae bacterium]